jgi:signal transduction histidine kinase
VLSQLASIELLTGIVAWVAARLSRASVDATSQALERERELTALKDQFIIYANHELRTPVMTLYNNLEVLEMLGEGGDSAAHERALRRALTSGDVVLGLLHSVLDISALEASQPRIEAQSVALAPLVRAVLETFDPREVGEPGLEEGAYQARAATVEIPAELVVWADEGRVRQVLVNLVANALKYSAPGTPITITASILEDRQSRRSRRTETAGPRSQRTSAAGTVRVSVRDMGLGVPPRDANKLFNRFVRLERDIAGPVRGTGVGLYLCRVLVEAMGGRIWVESAGVPGRGSTFSFTLPVPQRVA